MRRISLSSLSLILITAMLLFSAAVLSLLCSRAVETQRRAARLSEAVVAAGSVSELYYAGSDAAELAGYLAGEVTADGVRADLAREMELNILFTSDGGLRRADISVSDDSGEIFSMSCLKAVETEAR